MLGDQIDEGPLESMRAFGATEEYLVAMRDWIHSQQQTVLIWPCNAQAMEVFQSLADQWDLYPNGKRRALNRPAILATLTLLGMKKRQRRDTFERLQVLEAAALEAGLK